MPTVASNLMILSTVTGSWPLPRWFDISIWGRSLDRCLMDVRFREKFQDALAVALSDQQRAGLDIPINGDYQLDEDMAGRSWHHYHFYRWNGSDGDYMQAGQTPGRYAEIAVLCFANRAGGRVNDAGTVNDFRSIAGASLNICKYNMP